MKLNLAILACAFAILPGCNRERDQQISAYASEVTAGGVPAVWLLALIGFGVALVWLLERHAEIGHRPGWDDVHA